MEKLLRTQRRGRASETRGLQLLQVEKEKDCCPFMLSMHFTAQRRWMSCECFVNEMGWMFALLRRTLILAHFSHFPVVITLRIYFSWGLKKKKHPRILYQKIKLSLNTKESVSKPSGGLRCWCLRGKSLSNAFSWQNRTSYCKNRILTKKNNKCIFKKNHCTNHLTLKTGVMMLKIQLCLRKYMKFKFIKYWIFHNLSLFTVYFIK